MSSFPESSDWQGLLAHHGSNVASTPDSDLPSNRRVRSEDSNASDSEFQKLLSSRQLGAGSASQDTIRHRRTSTAQQNRDRMAELRAQMVESQKQIQQLKRAQQAVRDAVSGITTTQELLHVTPVESRAASKNDETFRRNASHRTTNSKWSEMQAETGRPGEPFHQPPNVHFQGPVDDMYYKLNPWYGQAPKRPVWSLGKPLPHTVREKLNQQQEQAKREQDLEQGKDHEKKPTYRLGEPLPHEEGTQPVSHHEWEFSSGDNLPHSASGKIGQKPRHKATFQSPPETEEQEKSETQLPYENQAAANPTGSEGQAPLDGDGRPEKYFNPFASFDELANYAPDNTKWAIDAEPIGQNEQDEAETGEEDPDELRNWWARIRAKHPEPLAEFLCTTVSIFLGICATLQVKLSNGEYGSYETACWAWGIAFMFGIYLGGGVSGAHMNPAISFSLWIFRGFPAKQMGIYFIAQVLGCTVAAALAYAVFHDTIHHVDPGMVDTATSFYSKPQAFVQPATAFFTQFLASAFMMMSVLSLGDDQNNPPGAGLHALIMGLLVTAQKMTLGYNTGVALNPASDFGPRLVCLMVGYKTNMFTEVGLWWLWGPWVSTGCGSVVGCAVYDSFVFVGSESPVNYRLPEKYRNRLAKVAPKVV